MQVFKLPKNISRERSQNADMAVSPQTSRYSSELESLWTTSTTMNSNIFLKVGTETMPLLGHPRSSLKINSTRNQRVSTCTIYHFALMESANVCNKISLQWPTEARWQFLSWTLERKITTCLPRLPPTFSGGPEKHGYHRPRYYILWAGGRQGLSWCLRIHRNNDLGNFNAPLALHVCIFSHILCWDRCTQNPNWIMSIPDDNSSDASVYLFMWYSKYFFLERKQEK